VQLLISKVQQQQISWRRDRILELQAQGFNQSDIATVLQIDKSIISRDMAYLRQQAQQKIKTHIEKTMPEEYQKGMVAIDQVLRITWGIVSKTADEKVRLQALALIDQCNSHKMDMVTNGSIIKDALTYVNGKAEKLGQQIKAEEKSAFDYESESEEEEEPDYGEEEELEEKQENDTGELEEEKTADEDIDIEKTHNDIF
jgi:hypothetical protein